MATTRKRETKKGVIYDIQVRIKDKGSGKIHIKTTTWRPAPKLTAKQADRAAEIYAAEFEEQSKIVFASNSSNFSNLDISFRDYATQYLEKMLRLAKKDGAYSLGYYEICKDCLDDAIAHIGGYTLTELTPIIIQSYYDKIDMRERIITSIFPVSHFSELLSQQGFTYNKLRYESKVQHNTLSKAIKGNAVSKKWARDLCHKTKIPFDILFYITEERLPYAHETGHRIKRAIRALLAQAKKSRLVADNYASADYIHFPPKPNIEIECMDDKSAQIFFQAVMYCTDIRIRTAMLIFILTGLRRGEVAGLQWQFIDFIKNTLTVHRTVRVLKQHGKIIKDPKTKSSRRTLSIPKLLVEALMEYKDWWDRQIQLMGDIVPPNTNWLFFQDNGDVISPTTFNKWQKQILAAAGLPNYTLHSLRHTNITLQIAAGIPIVTVSARAGHARTSTTSDIYAHFIRSSDAAAADALDDIFGKK